MKVLLVDDDEFAYHVLESYLEEIPGKLSIRWADSYATGMQKLFGGEVDVCLLDYQLGERSGLDFLREVVSRGCRTPIVMLTGQGDHQLDLEAMTAGAVDYLVKGEFGAAVLERVVRYALERARTLERLRESEERYALAVLGSNDGVWDWKVGGEKIYFSPRWKQILGFQDGEIPNEMKAWHSRVHPDDLVRLQSDLAAHVSGKIQHFESEHRVMHRDGTWRWVLARGMAVRSEIGVATRMAGSLTDVTQSRSRDVLTGLPNRVLYLDRLERAFARARREGDYTFAVLFLDLDRFKIVNDSLGHFAGDELLVGIARRLESCMRGVDTVARIGGDEFTILLDHAREPDGPTRVAERVIESVSKPFEIAGREVYTGASVGIAIYHRDYQRPEEILRDADTAMYRAKSLGRGRYAIFDDVLHQRAVSILHLESELRRAVEANQLEVHYQPIVSVADRRLLGFEALARWRHPQRGLIAPEQFIPLAEETGQVVEIDRWVLKEACTQLKEWQTHSPAHRQLFVAVNASRRQFERADWVPTVWQTLEEAKLDPCFLSLEVTESVVSDNTDAVIAVLSKLRDGGVRLVMDDFGTGYSSLSYLHRLPFSGIKIDRSFVSQLDVPGHAVDVVRAIIVLARGLKLGVTAEGVETDAQLTHLAALDCEQAQGYLLGRPLDARAVAELISSKAALARP